jgi:hypothetical protein
MPRISKLDFDMVARAIRRLELAKKKVTIANIRVEMGNFGCNSRIALFKAQWETARADEIAGRVPGEVEHLRAENTRLKLRIAELEKSDVDPALLARIIHWEQVKQRPLRPYEKTKLARGVDLDDDEN